jgi:uncharacterized protein (DUF2267 family)
MVALSLMPVNECSLLQSETLNALQSWESIVMTTGLDVFDSTLQQSNLWLKEIMGRLKSDDRHLAYQGLRATLHVIRDRIGPENAVHFGAQLPMLLRGLYYEGWRISYKPTHTRHIKDFLDDIETEMRRHLGDYREDVVQAVFDTIADRIDPGEVSKLIKLFPDELKPFWGAGIYSA